MSKKKLSKLLALYLPYVVIGLVATNLGEAWRLLLLPMAVSLRRKWNSLS